jgi:hypothetical protein
VTHADRMARFLAGHWTRERPTEPGLYPVRSSDGIELWPFAWILYYNDPVSGAVKSEPANAWTGEFWSMPWPGMPEGE